MSRKNEKNYIYKPNYFISQNITHHFLLYFKQNIITLTKAETLTLKNVM